MNDIWLQCFRSILSLTFTNAEGRVSSGTAFKIGNHLVTNNHVIQVPSAKNIALRSVLNDGYSTNLDIKFGHLEFKSMLIDGDPEANWDYAILQVTRSEFDAVPSLPIAETNDVLIGTKVALFGYQFDQPNLSMHVGHISSQYHKAGVHYIQLDSSVNNGNSGGPLIDISTGHVIGIVTRKETGLTQQFDSLLQANRQNIELLETLNRGDARGFIAGLNPVEATLDMQKQMERVSKEIYRSANVGIGYAYHISKVRSGIANLQ